MSPKSLSKVGFATLVLLGYAAVAVSAQMSIMDIEKTSAQIEDLSASAVTDVPALTPEECGANMQNATAELANAFAPCLASQSASEACCKAVEMEFNFEDPRFGGCLCHPIVMNTVLNMADSFLPGASAMIPQALNDCTANYSANFAFFGQELGNALCDESVFVNTNETYKAGLDVAGPMSVNNEDDIDTSSEAAHDMDTALTIFGVLTAEECGNNLLADKDTLINTMAPCIMSQSPTAACCQAVESTFQIENNNFGGCLCHQEVMDGIFEEAEKFLPGATSLIQSAFVECTDQHGSKFPFSGQEVGTISCTGEALGKPSLKIQSAENSTNSDPFGFFTSNAVSIQSASWSLVSFAVATVLSLSLIL